MTPMTDRIAALFDAGGDRRYSGEPVTQLAHALQSAALAERDGAPDPLVIAALLHDLGHLVNDQGETPTARGVDDRHEFHGARFLRDHFVPAVTEPIRLHVAAKRYLCATRPDYLGALSADSRRSLELQGGAFDAAGIAAFERQPFAADAVRLRQWDDAAKVAGRSTPPLAAFLARLPGCLRSAGGPAAD